MLEFDFEESEIAEQLIKGIEQEYGKSVIRIPCFELTDDPNIFNIKIIFTDFRLFEGKIYLIEEPLLECYTFRVEGSYY